MPKVTSKILDNSGIFTIEWEDSLQKAGLMQILTEKLRDYWKERVKRFQKNIPQFNQPQIPNQPRPMEYNRRHFRTNSQGNQTRTEEEKTQTTDNVNKQQHNR